MTEIRVNLSKKNPYWLPKHRYYELKHFCLQYPDWKRFKSSQIFIPSRNIERVQREPVDTVAKQAIIFAEYCRKIDIVESTCKDTDPVLWPYILTGVTEDVGYTYLSTVMDIPCSKELYYKKYHQFFHLLSQKLLFVL